MNPDRFSNWDVALVPPGLARVRAIAMLTIAALIAFKALGATATSTSPPVPQIERLTATVNAVDSRAGTIDLLTGVGHALRIVHVHIPRRLEMRDVHGARPMTALSPGSIVYVEYQRTPAGMMATTLELREMRPRGVK